MRPEGFSAVMAHRVSSPDDLDYFPTPPWAARAGAEIIRALDPEALSCWEPACGGGHMVAGLRDYFPETIASDVHDHGGWLSPLERVGDFTDPDFAPGIVADWIITNPPFVMGEAFVRQAWARAERGVAMLLRLQFLEGKARFHLFRERPLHTVAVFSERVPMVKGRWDPDASSATAYAWFIWTKPALGFAGEPRVIFIEPGAKQRLSNSDDVRRFVGMPDAPLFAGSAA